MTFSLDQKIPFAKENNLSAKLRPSGRFSLIQIFRKKTKRVFNHANEIEIPQAVHTVQQLDDTYSKLVGGDFSPLREVPPGCPVHSGDVGLSDEAISPNRSKRGSKGINSRQRDILCWGAATLERLYTKTNLSFLTYTLPPLSPEDLLSVKANWADITNRVVLRIKEKLHGKGIVSAVVGCVELQLERYRDTGVVYPHLHLVFRGRLHNQCDWAVKPHQFRRIWRSCVSKFLSSSGHDWRASENVQRINKSVAGYLAKYISKCGSKAEPELLSAWHPRDWIILGRRLRCLYERLTYSGVEVSRLLDSVIRGWHPGLGYVNSVYIASPGAGQRRIGWVGWLKGEETYPTYAELHPYVAPE